MAGLETIRINKVLKEFNIGLSTLVEFLGKKNPGKGVKVAVNENDVEIEIESSGATVIQPTITYTSKANSVIFWEYGSEAYPPFKVILAESSLDVPNAFSPNGDGINDYFNVYNAKSLVSFNAAIFNRWGQKLYSWGLDEIGCEGCGWDGTYKGNPVKAGVYFVVVKAKGADGIEYEFRKDVNLLRGYNEEVGN